jgi:hypothetical protein
MSNPLTGDYEAVLQVSGATLNRLLASMHQNAGADPGRPSFPHSLRMRIGDPTPIDGLRGTAAVQVSTPLVELIHGSEDRFRLEVAIRAQYKGDPGTDHLPELIHGTVRAEYRIETIDHSCFGWKGIADDYVWVRVVGPSVSFTGTAVDDTDLFSVVSSVDQAAVDAKITRLIRVLLKTRFEATPQKMSSRRFRRGTLRSLNVGVNRSAVAVPLGVTTEPPPGRLHTVSQVFLDGRDFGVAISRDVILAPVQQELDRIRSEFSTTIQFIHRRSALGVQYLEINITWRITLKSATAEWFGGTLPLVGANIGVVVVKIAGEARTQKSIFNWDFDVTQMLMVSYAGGDAFTLAPLGAPAVNITGPFGGVVSAFGKTEIANRVGPYVKNAADALAGGISLGNQRAELVKQLKTLDALADAHFTDAMFSMDGVALRGHIALSPRHPPQYEFAPTAEGDGYTALQAWIPGGRIDRFDWSWSWFNNARPPGTAAHDDRFLLRRPGGHTRGKFGGVLDLRRPLPGLDGMGRVCLAVQGMQVHPVSGDQVPVATTRHCRRYGFDIALEPAGGVGRLLVRERAPGPRDPLGPVSEIALLEVGGRRGEWGTNTLVVFLGEQWDRETGAVVRNALFTSRRRDAGLLVVLLFRDGARGDQDPDVATEIAELSRELEAPLMVNEDVGGTWSSALGVEPGGDLEWRLVSPTGGVTWAHRGRLAAEDLAHTLDTYLFPGQPPAVRHSHPGVLPGARISGAALASIYVDLGDYLDFDAPCPPPPIGRLGIDAQVVFAQKGSAASQAAIRRALRARGDDQEGRPVLAVVYDRTGVQEPGDVHGTEEDGVVTLPDPDGRIATVLGIRTWPTTVSIDEHGIVTAVDIGLEDGGHESGAPEAAS